MADKESLDALLKRVLGLDWEERARNNRPASARNFSVVSATPPTPPQNDNLANIESLRRLAARALEDLSPMQLRPISLLLDHKLSTIPGLKKAYSDLQTAVDQGNFDCFKNKHEVAAMFLLWNGEFDALKMAFAEPASLFAKVKSSAPGYDGPR